MVALFLFVTLRSICLGASKQKWPFSHARMLDLDDIDCGLLKKLLKYIRETISLLLKLFLD